MEIKTCEQYVLDQLEQARAERDWLRGKLEQAQDEAEELRGKLMERGERDASKVEQAIRKEGRRKLYRDGTGYSTSVEGGAGMIGIYERSLCQSYASAFRDSPTIGRRYPIAASPQRSARTARDTRRSATAWPSP